MSSLEEGELSPSAEQGPHRLGGGIELGTAGLLAPGPFLIARALCWMLVLTVGVVVLSGLPGMLGLKGVNPPARIFVAWTMSALTVLIYAVTVRTFEGRPPEELAPAWLIREGGSGFVIGVLLFSLVMLSLYLSGLYTLQLERWTNWPAELLSAMQTGLIEELLLRAIIFRLLMRAFGAWPAILVSGALFGVLHLLGPHASFVAAGAVAAEAGCMLAAAYLVTGRLWLPVGIHIGWNFAEASIFSASVSGHVSGGGLFLSAPVPGRSDLLTGGTFGPEASLAAVVAGVALFCVLMKIAYLGPIAAAGQRLNSPAGHDAGSPSVG